MLIFFVTFFIILCILGDKKKREKNKTKKKQKQKQTKKQNKTKPKKNKKKKTYIFFNFIYVLPKTNASSTLHNSTTHVEAFLFNLKTQQRLFIMKIWKKRGVTEHFAP